MELSFEKIHVPFPSFFYKDFKRPSKCIEGLFLTTEIQFVCEES